MSSCMFSTTFGSKGNDFTFVSCFFDLLNLDSWELLLVEGFGLNLMVG